MRTEQAEGQSLRPLPGITPGRARRIVLLLAASVALMMTGYGIAMPVFAPRLTAIGAGVAELGLMTVAFALGQLLLAPWLGALADRHGRKPPILLALLGLVLANLAFVASSSVAVYTLVRFFQGTVTAGLLPAAMGVVSDLMPRHERGRWVGVVMGSYGAGFIFGPALGGLLLELWGFAAPFLVSAGLGLLALLFALAMLPETRQAHTPAAQTAAAPRGRLLESLPRPLHLLATLLALDFAAVFGFAFTEPQMTFYLYNQLRFSPSAFGLIVGAYGLTTVLAQMLLGPLSDRLGRRWPIAAGFGLNICFFLGLILAHDLAGMILAAVLGGLGSSLINPALSASYLDISDAAHRARVMGVKSSVASSGAIAGPLLVALCSRWLAPQAIFALSALSGLLAAGLALLALGRLSAAARAPDGQQAPRALGEEPLASGEV